MGEQHDAMTDEPAIYAPLYLQGIELFNDCEFFEAHEVWEDLWTEYRGEDRKFYQGIIQVAVALQHFTNGNLRGAQKVYVSSRKYLEQYLPVYEGLDLEEFLAQYERCFQEANQYEAIKPTDMPKPEIDPELIPEIRLV